MCFEILYTKRNYSPQSAKEIGSDEGGVGVQDFEPVQQNFE
jgi:hypothetical protein